MISQRIWIGITIGVLFAGIGIGYTLLPSTQNVPMMMTPQQMQQMMNDPNQITQWKQQLLENVSQLFGKGQQSRINADDTVKELHAKIGRLTVENDFLAKVLGR